MRKTKGPRYVGFKGKNGTRRAKIRIPLGHGKYKDMGAGLYGTPESRALFRDICRQWEDGQKAGQPVASLGLTVADLLAAFFVHAANHYRDPDGQPTSELASFRQSVLLLDEMHGGVAAYEFGPLMLKGIRQAMIRAGWVRKTINQRIGRIKRIFKWAASEQLVPASVYSSLATVAGLTQGRSGAHDRPEVPPAPAGAVRAVYRLLAPQLRAMVHLQRLTGMRPGEVCRLRVEEIDQAGPSLDGVQLWVYRPRRHKTQWHGHSRFIVLGPRAQRILRPWLEMGIPISGYVFHPKRRTSGPYSVQSYGRRIREACAAAGVAAWRPGQLRHSAATAIQQAFGLDGARAALGHRNANVTTIYAERDIRAAAEIARKIG